MIRIILIALAAVVISGVFVAWCVCRVIEALIRDEEKRGE